MTSKEEISLAITKAVIEKMAFTPNEIKTLPYEIYNSIYENIKTNDDEPIIL